MFDFCLDLGNIYMWKYETNNLCTQSTKKNIRKNAVIFTNAYLAFVDSGRPRHKIRATYIFREQKSQRHFINALSVVWGGPWHVSNGNNNVRTGISMFKNQAYGYLELSGLAGCSCCCCSSLLMQLKNIKN